MHYSLHRLIVCILIICFSNLGFAQSSEQKKMIERAKKMQDSILNLPIFKELQQINTPSEIENKQEKEVLKIAAKKKSSPKNANPRLENYPFGSLDVNVLVLPFGMDKPIKIGTILKSGDIHLEFPNVLQKLSDKDKEDESLNLWYTLFSTCKYGTGMDAENENFFSFNTGP